MGGEVIEDIDGEGSDGEAIRDGKISVTPIHLDLTNHAFADQLRTWTLQEG